MEYSIWRDKVPEQIKTANNVMDHLAAQPLSPNRLFVYWQLDDKKIAFICRYFNIIAITIVRTLRLYELTFTVESGGKPKLIHEVILRPETSSWLFKGVKYNGDYLVEVGIMRSEGMFFPMLRFNEVNSKLSSSNSPKIGEFAEKTPVWSDHVSTYTYYENVEGSNKK
jgi:hypothetical protein